LPFGNTHGGKRHGAGRKPAGAKRGVPHRPRKFTSGRHPLHVTLKVVRDLPGLRRRNLWKAVQWALAITVQRADFRICHMSIQGNHIHLIVEADDRQALARGMQGFQISCAKQLNARILVGGQRRRGRVFADRYHAEILDKPTRVRRALAYVLNNWRRHRVDQGSRYTLDPFSTAYQFDGWAERQDVLFLPKERTEWLPVSYPTTWLLTTGWKRGGGLISVEEVPGPR
jgi:REP element-mobilizing transposase RayT